MKFIDFFSGIGGFRLGMEMAGHECVGHCEIDKFADKSYRAMHDVKEGEWYASDIRAVEPGDLPEADCYCGGFPCQAFSVAGKRGGFEDTRGTLFFEVMRLAAVRKPKYLFMENVAGLLSHDGGKTFGTILNTLGQLGYWYEYQVLNSKNYGVPQNRERVFIIGHLGKYSGGEIFPITGSDSETLKQLVGGSQGNRVYDTGGVSCTLASQAGGKGAKTGLYMVQAVLTPDREEKRQNGRRIKDVGDPMLTLTAQDKHGVMLRPVRTEYGKAVRKQYEAGEIEESRHNMTQLEPRQDDISNTLTSVQKDNLLLQEARIRRLTPRECFRLQGFPYEYFDRAAAVNSDSQLYKQAGNSVTVNVIYEIARRLQYETRTNSIPTKA
jgi:DNA (cytosine-5)-methyltransferase 1